MKPTPTKRSAKGRKMYAFTDYNGKFHVVNDSDRLKMRSANDSIPDYVPVFVLPAAPEDVERMREAVAKALHDNNSVPGYRPPWETKSPGMKRRYYVMADAALSTLGILTPTKKTKASP